MSSLKKDELINYREYKRAMFNGKEIEKIGRRTGNEGKHIRKEEKRFTRVKGVKEETEGSKRETEMEQRR